MNLFLFSFLLFPIFCASMPHGVCTQRKCVIECRKADYRDGECVRKATTFNIKLVCKCYAFYKK
ncbi:unnamed protein product [Cylicocyclus nassatus]|uniref:Uncharacterized protein n=1 Tax=Cylicocyclus nassatus TaxID=53992 RepID=A0AA36GNN1_CYLNA|nr:unnamed protein product [Cylicocyclus nassatus]